MKPIYMGEGATTTAFAILLILQLILSVTLVIVVVVSSGLRSCGTSLQIGNLGLVRLLSALNFVIPVLGFSYPSFGTDYLGYWSCPSTHLLLVECTVASAALAVDGTISVMRSGPAAGAIWIYWVVIASTWVLSVLVTLPLSWKHASTATMFFGCRLSSKTSPTQHLMSIFSIVIPGFLIVLSFVTFPFHFLKKSKNQAYVRKLATLSGIFVLNICYVLLTTPYVIKWHVYALYENGSNATSGETINDNPDHVTLWLLLLEWILFCEISLLIFPKVKDQLVKMVTCSVCRRSRLLGNFQIRSKNSFSLNSFAVILKRLKLGRRTAVGSEEAVDIVTHEIEEENPIPTVNKPQETVNNISENKVNLEPSETRNVVSSAKSDFHQIIQNPSPGKVLKNKSQNVRHFSRSFLKILSKALIGTYFATKLQKPVIEQIKMGTSASSDHTDRKDNIKPPVREILNGSPLLYTAWKTNSPIKRNKFQAITKTESFRVICTRMPHKFQLKRKKRTNWINGEQSKSATNGGQRNRLVTKRLSIS